MSNRLQQNAAPGESIGSRVDAFLATKEFYVWMVHHQVGRMRDDLATVKAFAGKPERFALWSDVIYQMSHPGPLENALGGLYRLGVITKSALGRADGISWLTGPSEGSVQILWPFWTDNAWAEWCFLVIVDATGASKLGNFKKAARAE